MEKKLEAVAHIHTPYPEKFGIPRQSGLVAAPGEIVFTPAYRSPDAVRGIEEFSHLWLLWEFSGAGQEGFVPLVSPPRLGGKEKRGVFATRSPFRPNSIGLSSVALKEVRLEKKRGPVLLVEGADLLDGTPIYDIKPYLPYTDSHPEAAGGFGQMHSGDGIAVDFPKELLMQLPRELQKPALDALAQDPRAAYNKRPDYMYGMAFGDYDIRFVVDGTLVVRSVSRRNDGTFCKIKGRTGETGE
ncbi:MAG: tRNA (N6-threonylcarbamoyladenosine(37)-N6)-methyltransferase TrmO [Muribaculaceae bacterium]|nr:tRNA (N6-threonylcarbamoyladenosine(37)-N6)-methyltransferase TrmO [Roseburia sp.]MCM1431498.1 tRNA (N6-threonylcarbamoyladenosine(37)-N6)-methyltransferase TrmO [Muribaculaceae bacterium]MCM1493208.1 tRNA (N6-threonylcarbamoyladenosine(37)-N6)-methyltransferase TrmO [Muribaculaceae bacterium]